MGWTAARTLAARMERTPARTGGLTVEGSLTAARTLTTGRVAVRRVPKVRFALTRLQFRKGSQNSSARAMPRRRCRAQGFRFTFCGVRRDAVSKAEACVPSHLHCRQRTCATCARIPASVEYGGLIVSHWPPASESERLLVPLAALEDAATASNLHLYRKAHARFAGLKAPSPPAPVQFRPWQSSAMLHAKPTR